jgi:membrane protease YdiL (CAAX protease family)
MPQFVDHVLVVLVVVGLALRAWFGLRTLRALAPEQLPAARPRLWARAIATQWSLAIAVSAWWSVQHRAWGALGLSAGQLWGFGGVMLGIVVMLVALAAQRRTIATSADIRVRLRKRLASVAALLPGRREDWPGFVSLAITAGICEELLFRGFVTWWLLCYVPLFWVAIVVQAALFGLAHAYQGPRGVFTAGAMGLFLGGVVWVTGSLWAAMILHALMDLHAGDTALRVYEADAAAPSAPA